MPNHKPPPVEPLAQRRLLAKLVTLPALRSKPFQSRIANWLQAQEGETAEQATAQLATLIGELIDQFEAQHAVLMPEHTDLALRIAASLRHREGAR